MTAIRILNSLKSEPKDIGDFASVSFTTGKPTSFASQADNIVFGIDSSIDLDTSKSFISNINIQTNIVSDIEKGIPVVTYPVDLFQMDDITSSLFLNESPYNSPDEVNITLTNDIRRFTTYVWTVAVPFSITNIEFLNGAVWESKFDNSHWSPLQGSWNGSAWDSTGAGFLALQIDAIGTWKNGYRPTKVRLTIEAQ